MIGEMRTTVYAAVGAVALAGQVGLERLHHGCYGNWLSVVNCLSLAACVFIHSVTPLCLLYTPLVLFSTNHNQRMALELRVNSLYMKTMMLINAKCINCLIICGY